VLDVGCGRAELLGYLLRHGIEPLRYTGLEAQAWLVRSARRRRYPTATIIQADFVREPSRMRVGAEVVVFSGSLNFLPSREFYDSLRAAWVAAGEALAFNFLTSPLLAGARGLRWHGLDSVLAFARDHAPRVAWDDTYEEGDATVVMRRTPAASRRRLV
jgi:hypothetical protein